MERKRGPFSILARRGSRTLRLQHPACASGCGIHATAAGSQAVVHARLRLPPRCYHSTAISPIVLSALAGPSLRLRRRLRFALLRTCSPYRLVQTPPMPSALRLSTTSPRTAPHPAKAFRGHPARVPHASIVPIPRPPGPSPGCRPSTLRAESATLRRSPPNPGRLGLPSRQVRRILRHFWPRMVYYPRVS